MKNLNQVGPPAPITGPLQQLSLEALESAYAADALVIDLRPSDAYATGHILGALNLPYGPMLLRWGVWLIDAQRQLVLLGTVAETESARTALSQIGADLVGGAITPDVLEHWVRAGRPTAAFRRVPAAELQDVVAAGARVIDVRRPSEYAAGHIPGSINMPLGELPQLLRTQPAVAGPLVVHCQGGGRSPVAAGLLAAAGWGPIDEMSDGLNAWTAALVRVSTGG